MIAAHADVVGMTVASECVAANQLGLDYAAVCIVDNLANGVGDALLTPEEYRRGQEANQRRLLDALGRGACPRCVAVSVAVVGRRARRRDASGCAPRTGRDRARARTSCPSRATTCSTGRPARWCRGSSTATRTQP